MQIQDNNGHCFTQENFHTSIAHKCIESVNRDENKQIVVLGDTNYHKKLWKIGNTPDDEKTQESYNKIRHQKVITRK